MARIVPYAAVHFGAYEYYRQALVDQLAPREPSSAPPSPVWDLLAGSAAGGTAVLATYPLDLVRARHSCVASDAPCLMQQAVRALTWLASLSSNRLAGDAWCFRPNFPQTHFSMTPNTNQLTVTALESRAGCAPSSKSMTR